MSATSANAGAILAHQVLRGASRQDIGPGRAKLVDWLNGIEKQATARALRDLLAAAPAFEALIVLIAEHSPYLWQLMRADPDRLLRLASADPDAHFASLLVDTVDAMAIATDEAEAARLLRGLKAEAALLIALADVGEIWPVTRTTCALTQLADAAVGAALRFVFRLAAAEAKVNPKDPQYPELDSGYFVLAMGKMGAFELNYSSDIDLIVLFDPTATTLAPSLEPGPFFVRLTRRLVKLLQERTVDGYVFRVDLRLRPDPASTQIAMSTTAALSYYESIGQNWERAALIKARPCAGDIAAGNAFLKDLAPFVWRKYLDYAAIADVHAMKRQMHAYRGHGEIAAEGHNIKLGRGGIREIEFFVQTQQLIAGGRHPQLRTRRTLATLEILAQGGWIAPAAAHQLDETYRFLRTVEHRLQMVADEQTHTLPSDPEALGRFARFLGYADRDAFAAVLIKHLRQVQQHYSRLFEEASEAAAKRRALIFPPDHDDVRTLDKLTAMGFRRSLEASTTVRQWLSGSYPALRGEFARRHLSELVPILFEHLSTAETPDSTLRALDRFLHALRGGARLLSLLLRNPDLVALLTLILGNAPRLADTLAQHPQAMDGLIDPAFFGPLPDATKLATRLRASLGQSASYEDFLDSVRLFGQEHLFLIGARILSGTSSAEQAGEAFARLADVIIRELHQAMVDLMVARHGILHNGESAVLAAGKLGGWEMTAASDLDLMLIYEFDRDRPESDGEQPLHATQYFARLTKRLVSALATQTNHGSLYNVDMRLRPSGRSGPLATQIDGFASYHEHDAWTWEHMALTRVRVISASAAFAERTRAVIRAILCRPRNAVATAADVIEMRRAIATEKGDADRWDIKNAAGGLIDLEFIAQYLQLVHAWERPDILDTSTAGVLERAVRLGLLSAQNAEILRPAARLYQALTQVLRLCLSGPFDPKTANAGLLALLARAADVPDFAALDAHLRETQAKVRTVFEQILGRLA